MSNFKSFLSSIAMEISPTKKAEYMRKNAERAEHQRKLVEENCKKFDIQDGILTQYIGTDSVVIVPNGVTHIAESAFSNRNDLISITIPDSVISIAVGAFHGCSSLESMTLPFVGRSASESGGFALFGTIFGYLSYDGGIATTQYYYKECYCTHYIPETLKNVTVTGGKVPSHAFYGCTTLTNITLSDCITSIDDYAFAFCTGLMRIGVPCSATSIGSCAFLGCTNLASVYFPEKCRLTHIASEAFKECAHLRSAYLPKSVTQIDYHAFAYCPKLYVTVPKKLVDSYSYTLHHGHYGLHDDNWNRDRYASHIGLSFRNQLSTR